MGQNKLLLTFQGKPLIAHAVDTLLASAVDEVVVVLGHEADKVREKLAGKKVIFVENPDYREGLSTSVRAGIAAVAADASAIMIYLADQPLPRTRRHKLANPSLCGSQKAQQEHCRSVLPRPAREPGDSGLSLQ